MVDYYDQLFRASQNVTPTNLRLDPYQAMTEARRRQLQSSPMVPGALQGGMSAPVTGYGNPPRPEINPTIRDFTSSGQPTPSLTPGAIYGGMGVPTTGYGNAPAQQVNPVYNDYSGYQPRYEQAPSMTPGALQGGTSVDPAASAIRQGNAVATTKGIQSFDQAATAAREVQAEAKKAEIDAKTTEQRLTEAAAAQTAQADEAASAAGTEMPQAQQDAYQRNLADILRSIDIRKEQAGTTYSGMYQDVLAQQSLSRGLSDVSGFTGGMAEQLAEKRSAAETRALTELGVQRQQAIDAIEAQKMTAELEAGRMTAEQFELQKQYNPMWMQGELLAQKYEQTGDINDFNEYMTHMSSLLGLEPSLANINNPEAMQAQISADVVTQVNQYIQNPSLMQNLMGGGTSALTGLGAAFAGAKGIAALGTIGTALLGPGGIAASTAAGLSGALTGTQAGFIAALGGKAAAAAAIGSAAFWPVVAGVLATVAVAGVVRAIRANKSPEQAEVAINDLLAKERQRIIDQGFSEAEADEAITGLRKTLPSRYQQ